MNERNDYIYKNPSVLIKDRVSYIKEKARGKTVLDVGCVDHEATRELGDFWLHKIIKGVAKDILGVDLNSVEVAKLNQKGYEIIVGDVEKINLGKKFELIIAGELIEHLSNPGLFLENMRKHLKDGGFLIITTPNAYALRYALRHIMHGIVVLNPEHTFYFDYFTLKELCERNGFFIKESYYFFDNNPGILKYFLLRMATVFRKSYAPRVMFVLEKNI